MMNTIPLYRPTLWSRLPRLAVGAIAVAALCAAAGAAFAGECPLSKQVADGLGQKPGPTMPVGRTSDRTIR